MRRGPSSDQLPGSKCSTSGACTASLAVGFGRVVGVGDPTAMAYQVAIDPNTPRPLLYAAVNAPYFIGTSVLSAVIMVATR